MCERREPFHDINEVVIKGYVTGSMCLFAIIGNTFSTFILSSRQMRSFPMNRILLSLSLVDLTFGLTNFICQVLITFADYYCDVLAPVSYGFYYWFHPMIAPFLYPIEIAGKTASEMSLFKIFIACNANPNDCTIIFNLCFQLNWRLFI